MSLMDAVRKSDDPGLMINTNISVIENKIIMSYKIKNFQEWCAKFYIQWNIVRKRGFDDDLKRVKGLMDKNLIWPLKFKNDATFYSRNRLT